MRKKADWQNIFIEFIEENRFKKFEWGKWDCCLFADACIKAMTGESVIPATLKWNNKETAQEAIVNYGKTLNGALTKACKAKKIKQIKPIYVTTGDLVLFKEETELVGISDGFNILAPSDNGLNVKSHDLIKKVWRIDV